MTHPHSLLIVLAFALVQTLLMAGLLAIPFLSTDAVSLIVAMGPYFAVVAIWALGATMGYLCGLTDGGSR